MAKAKKYLAGVELNDPTRFQVATRNVGSKDSESLISKERIQVYRRDSRFSITVLSGVQNGQSENVLHDVRTRG